jgi:hypothetical protein
MSILWSSHGWSYLLERYAGRSHSNHEPKNIVSPRLKTRQQPGPGLAYVLSPHDQTSRPRSRFLILCTGKLYVMDLALECKIDLVVVEVTWMN